MLVQLWAGGPSDSTRPIFSLARDRNHGSWWSSPSINQRGGFFFNTPGGDITRKKRGVFALRSPRRPNPIGVTEVDPLGIQDNVLTVRGLDAVDGTPVLDLKPA